MGIYSHQTTDQLTAIRDKLTNSLHDRLTAPTASSWGDRRIQFDQQTAEIRKEITAVNAELDSRNGTVARRPIYLV